MKKYKILAFIAIIAFILIGNITNAYAATAPAWINGKYTRSVSRISWWMSYDNNGGWYEYQIANAISNWQYPGWSNPLHFVESDSNAGTMMDIYSKPSSFWSTNVPMAETRHYDGNGNWMHPNSNRKLSGNYVFTRIYLNDTQMHNLSADKMKGTIAHEIGHTLGLDENNNNKYSIMCQTSSKRQVQTVQKIDNNVIVNIYK